MVVQQISYQNLSGVDEVMKGNYHTPFAQETQRCFASDKLFENV